MLLSIVGEHEHQIRLDYTPQGYNGLTCTDAYIIVAQCKSPPILHIYSWRGDRLTTVDLTHHWLGARDWVHCVAACDGGILHIAAGPDIDKSVTSLLALQVAIIHISWCRNTLKSVLADWATILKISLSGKICSCQRASESEKAVAHLVWLSMY